MRRAHALVSLSLALGCSANTTSAPTQVDASTVDASCAPVDAVDLLFVIDNSGAMRDYQLRLAGQIDALFDALTAPTGAAPARSLHVGVITPDLGTPGSVVPDCVNSDVGDDGLLNPIRNGQSTRGHQPWTSFSPSDRPARCTMDPSQYPSFLTFDPLTGDPAALRDDFACNALLSSQGCGIEQPLEAARRALVVHDPRGQPRFAEPNAGFLRDDAVLAIVIVSDEEDGSVRDCRWAESGTDCTDALSVFDSTSAAWASADMNLRFYLYRPGSAQDPTWSLDRYIDPARPDVGFLSLKPGHPERVVFAAITGVPLRLPTRAGGGPDDIDWAALLDTDGGLVAMSAEGPISMRQANMDPACSTRVVPACRREGSSYNPTVPACDSYQQPFGWPSRRIAEVARRFDVAYGNGAISSICADDYAPALRRIAGLIQRRLVSACP